MLRSLTTGCILGLTAVTCSASLLDDLGNLQGKLVVYAGEFEALDCPVSGKYDCTTWPMTMLKTRRGPEICLGTEKHVRCGYKCTGLIAVGEDKVPKAYVFSPMSSDATEIPVEKYRCPAPF
jgi:hypothetical protein